MEVAAQKDEEGEKETIQVMDCFGISLFSFLTY